MENQILPRDKKLKQRSSELRNGATKEENHLWYDFLRIYPIQFNRQRIIGEYIVDFYCSKARLVIEIDGAQHYEKEAMEYDEIRTKYLECFGLAVLRFSNHDIKTNFDGVCEAINTVIKSRIEDVNS